MRRSPWIRVLAVAVAAAVVSASVAPGHIRPLAEADHCGAPANPTGVAFTAGSHHAPGCPTGVECLTAAGCAAPPVALSGVAVSFDPVAPLRRVPVVRAALLDLFRTGPPTPPPNS